MARSTLAWLCGAVVVAFTTQVAAQTCYYPNGDTSSYEFPCSTAEGSACCPSDWICMDNGLCALPSQNLTGRYSCTDQSWDSPGCPSNLCTYNMAATGAENLKQCADENNEWCCNGDNNIVKCCEGVPQERPFFALPDGKAYATIGKSTATTAPTLSTFTGLAIADANAVSATVTSSKAESTIASTITSIRTSVSSGPGGVSTAVITLVITPSASADSGDDGGSSTNLGLIIGLAVGIPLALAMVGIIIWICRKRRNQKKSVYSNMDHDQTDVAGGGAAVKLGKTEAYHHSRPGTSEIDSIPAGPGQTVSAINGRAELGSGSDFQPGHGGAYTPDTVGIGGGSVAEWGGSPPGYSPGTAFIPTGHVELDSTPIMPPANEKEGKQYVGYQMPANNAVEMPADVGPPRDVEKRG